MPSFKITVAYDGTDYVGWQRQANGASVQGLIENALTQINGRAVTVAGAGRTDSGVHALAQVVGFALERSMPADVLVRALNAHLPEAIRVTAAGEVPPSFHARFAAHSKTYCYRILTSEVASPFERRYAWHVPGALDLGAMSAASKVLEGQHDFAAFQGAGSDVASTVRDVFSSRIADCGLRIDFGLPGAQSIADAAIRNAAICNPQSALLVYTITASGFLRHMVRTIVGTLVEIGRGRRSVESMAHLLLLHDRTHAGPTAPASGLFLVGVDYGPVCS
jgi:tRNA pseudouridine38-40 synthase